MNKVLVFRIMDGLFRFPNGSRAKNRKERERRRGERVQQSREREKSTAPPQDPENKTEHRMTHSAVRTVYPLLCTSVLMILQDSTPYVLYQVLYCGASCRLFGTFLLDGTEGPRSYLCPRLTHSSSLFCQLNNHSVHLFVILEFCGTNCPIIQLYTIIYVPQ